MIGKKTLAGVVLAAALAAGSAQAQTAPPPNDMLLATLWTQRSVEYKANALTVFALAKIRLDEALADKNWTAAPVEQKGDYQNLPPAVVLDVDETAARQLALPSLDDEERPVLQHQDLERLCRHPDLVADPGRGRVRQIRRLQGREGLLHHQPRRRRSRNDTRKNMDRYGFPMGGNVDTFLMQGEKPEWAGAKGARRAVVAASYRVLLNMGDNFGDFDDRYRSSEADRLKAFEANRARWGREWLVIANPTYGSFEPPIFGHDFKKSREEQRKAKYDVIEGWPGPK